MKLHGVQPLDWDRVHTAARKEALRVAAQALDGIQREAPHLQVAAVAALFAAFAQRTGGSAETMHHLGSRILRPEAHHTKDNGVAQSTLDFVGLCVMGQEVVEA
ncbi:hypothetical protein [Methylobacterium marchantiae]|uniref:Uncharacterized protein n=1 Tax=Methylobacterium marchantiae TaxID=600331 RepID=A0ABW3X286_9HYPH|nr:hypothetical protein AIGOOFII_3462 [Methylobacterium marchantiae]